MSNALVVGILIILTIAITVTYVGELLLNAILIIGTEIKKPRAALFLHWLVLITLLWVGVSFIMIFSLWWVRFL